MNAVRQRLRRLRNSRRGIVLLMVVSLLTLFVLIGVTYAVVATMYRDTAKNQAGRQLVGDPPDREIENVMYVLLRDSLVKSPFQYHSLLYDLYGDDGSKEMLRQNAEEENDGQVLKLTLVTNMDPMSPPVRPAQPYGRGLSPYDDYYAGQVVTFISGVAAGNSTRVLRYDSTNYVLYVEAIVNDTGAKLLPRANELFLINGRPFNGTGVGYQSSTRNIDATDGGDLVALLPNFNAYSTAVAIDSVRGADESWDIADFQNMFLAYVPADRNDGTLLPSYHRPDLVQYHMSKRTAAAFNDLPDDIRRRIMFRPASKDHPNFTGGNPNFNPVNGPWDVDNDGDGIADSIWIDPGLPVMTSKDGRRYKRLVAVLIKDLDGRINLNAHGSYQTADTSSTNNYVASTPVDSAYTSAFAGGSAGMKLPRGLGFGPAEIMFQHIFGSDTEYQNILTQRHYGADIFPGNQNDTFWFLKLHGHPENHYATPSGTQPSNPSWYMSPPDIWGRGLIGLDPAGQAIQLYMGQSDELKTTSNSVTYWNNPYMSTGGNSPLAGESYYTPHDLERLLRFSDGDAQSLSDRLEKAANSFTANDAAGQRRRDLVTTMASHIPMPRVGIPYEVRASGTEINKFQQEYPFTPNPVSPATTKPYAETAPTIHDLFQSRLSGLSGNALKTAMRQMIAWELLQGRRFDVNRPLGNGRDNDNDGIVDEPDELNDTWAASGSPPAYPTGFSGMGNYWKNGTGETTDVRQLYCRHLYCLAWACMNSTFTAPHTGETLTQQQQSELYSRRIAQWAVNVVDFRDSDSIMTGFEYDVNPADGWGVDGNLQTDEGVGAGRRVVWGMEAPDLLLMEVKSFHDRRTRDTDKDNAANEMDRTKTTDPNRPDADFDQYRMPQGSTFIELYCPRQRIRTNATRPAHFPAELYYYDTTNNVYKLDLDKTVSTPNGMGTMQMPVWQVIISDMQYGSNSYPEHSGDEMASLVPANTRRKPLSGNFDPRNPSLLPSTMGGPTTNLISGDWRRVWFNSQSPQDGNANRTFWNMRGTNADIGVGQYAVVGPREHTYLGSLDEQATSPNWRGNSPQALSISGGTFSQTDLAGGAVTYPQSPVGIIAEAPPPQTWMMDKLNDPLWRQGLNISEPLASGATYYQEPMVMASATLPRDAYADLDLGESTLPDVPFEHPNSSNTAWPVNRLNPPHARKTHENVRTFYLQRLADPTRGFDADTNPYITVDWATSDLSVFNGESGQPDKPVVASTPWGFGSRERGYRSGADRTVNLWYPKTEFPATSTAGAPATPLHFPYELTGTFGKLNLNLDNPNGNGEPNSSPFPWVTWNDRPFANPAELLIVPWSSPARFGFEFDRLPNVSTPPAQPNDLVYSPNWFLTFGRTDLSVPAPATSHLPSFHNSSQTSSGAAQSSDLYRLLDLLETPSPYAGTEKWFNPSTNTGDFSAGTADPTALIHRPPFNYRSNFRDPGRININTINDSAVWEGIAKQMPFMDPSVDSKAFYNKIVQSRQGTATGSPTIFGNPFRAAASADLMPDVAGLRLQKPVEATLLRSDSSGGTNPQPLFSFSSTATSTPSTGVTRNKMNNTDRNAYFKHQPLAKVANMLTTNSNCYAMWITVGYFEVEDVPTSGGPIDYTVYPDGLRLANEVGSLDGTIQRHRGFYLIDRSIPVAFEPGENHNVDRCILLRRMIE